MSKTAREVIADTRITTLEGKMSTLERVEDDLGEDNADKVIATLDAAGFVIVPKEPTQEMIEAGGDTDNTMPIGLPPTNAESH